VPGARGAVRVRYKIVDQLKSAERAIHMCRAWFLHAAVLTDRTFYRKQRGTRTLTRSVETGLSTDLAHGQP
jgi:hypothetical protein